MRYHRRQGWVCADGNFRGTTCLNEPIYRDEIETPVFPFEGTRRTTAPVPSDDLGIVAGDTVPFVQLIDHVTRDVYKLLFSEPLTATVVTGTQKGADYLRLPEGVVWYQNGDLMSETHFLPGDYIGLPAGIDAHLVGGVLTVTTP